MRQTKKSYRVLVTAVGGNVGQGVIKALRNSGMSFWIFGTDMDPLSAGFSMSDKFQTVPRTGSANFGPALKKIVEKERICAVFVCGPTETEWFSCNRQKLESENSVKILVNTSEVLKICEDKWLTAQFLKKNNLSFPESALGSDKDAVKKLIRKVGFPLFVKPRKSYASTFCFAAASRKELNSILKLRKDFVVQKLLDVGGDEYTAGLHSDSSGKVRASIILRRTLQRGTTYKTELIDNSKWDACLRDLIERLGSRGACNVQFRVEKNNVIPFEINARFSGTTGVRFRYGFNDAEMAFKESVLGMPVRQPKLRSGVMLRYWDEMWIPGKNFKALK